jgi:hypothetical protein
MQGPLVQKGPLRCRSGPFFPRLDRRGTAGNVPQKSVTFPGFVTFHSGLLSGGVAGWLGKLGLPALQ